MTFGERVNKLINDKGLKINGVEKELGFGNGTIRRWDTNSPSCDKVEKIANFLNVSVEYLITGKESTELTPEEQGLLEAYRNAAPSMRQAVRKLLDVPDISSCSAPELPGKSLILEDGKEAI